MYGLPPGHPCSHTTLAITRPRFAILWEVKETAIILELLAGLEAGDPNRSRLQLPNYEQFMPSVEQRWLSRVGQVGPKGNELVKPSKTQLVRRTPFQPVAEGMGVNGDVLMLASNLHIMRLLQRLLTL